MSAGGATRQTHRLLHGRRNTQTCAASVYVVTSTGYNVPVFLCWNLLSTPTMCDDRVFGEEFSGTGDVFFGLPVRSIALVIDSSACLASAIRRDEVDFLFGVSFSRERVFSPLVNCSHGPSKFALEFCFVLNGGLISMFLFLRNGCGERLNK